MKKRIKLSHLAVLLIITFLVFENIFLIVQNKNLKDIINNITLNNKKSLRKPGDFIKQIRVKDLNYVMNTLKFDEYKKNHLLFIFNTDCKHCEKNLSKWLSLFEYHDKSYCEIIAISNSDRETTLKWIKYHDIPFNVVINDDEDFKIFYVPQTILINNNGIIQGAWLGELDSSNLDSIKSKLNRSIE
ncbi:MAG TPA: redoxin domain-containing protein [Ignavibacteriaceae bacterium]|nr:redoxin domain-containing protein [Ignavibacteriaceae bacterium]HQI39895.1 redoxin domain-containing protein [Ignavibacteriaceae bacterium]